MSERIADEDLAETSPSERPHVVEEGASSPYVEDGDDNDDDDEMPSAQTPGSSAEAATPVTAATTPRAKFPSDLKTLACTWPGCGKTFNRPARLRDHLNSHTNRRPFKCPAS
ncbi:hypothetical protein CDD83_6529 [Cordyceps sp. RAO-2017]|nr:hypothetical protein CDD83_6529 [Cordyceps sp. RAO-2017]